MPKSATPSHAPQNGSLQRVTVNLTPRSVAALEEAGDLTSDTKTDIINRALQVYAYLERITRNGGVLYAREQGQDELERLRFI